MCNEAAPAAAVDQASVLGAARCHGAGDEAVGRRFEQIEAAVSSEKLGRAALSNAVTQLERRIDDGLYSLTKAINGRMAAEGAAEGTLVGLCQSVDELREQCAWPPGGGSGTLAAAVQQQLGSTNAELEVFRAWRAEQEQQQAEQGQWRKKIADELRALAASVADSRAQQDSWSSTQAEATRLLWEQLRDTSSTAERERQQLQQLLEQQQGERRADAAEGDAVARSAAKALEEQVKQVMEEQRRLADMAAQEQKRSLTAVEQLIVMIRAVEAEQHEQKSKPAEILQAVQGAEQKLSALQAEHQKVAADLAAMRREQEQLKAVQQQMQASVEAHAAVTRGEEAKTSEAVREIRAQQTSLRAWQEHHGAALNGAVAAMQEHKQEVARSGNENYSAVSELREEVAAVAGAVNVLFGRIGDMEAQDEAQRQLHAEVAAIANIVQKLAERVDRAERFDRIDRGHKEPRSPDVHAHEPNAESRRLQSPLQQPRQLHGAGSEDADAFSRTRRSLGSRKGDGCNSPQERPPPSSRKAPDPRNWLMEPLSVSVARTDAEYPSTLQPALQTAPNLGSVDRASVDLRR